MPGRGNRSAFHDIRIEDAGANCYNLTCNQHPNWYAFTWQGLEGAKYLADLHEMGTRLGQKTNEPMLKRAERGWQIK